MVVFFGAGFDRSIHFLDGAADHLLRLSALLRPVMVDTYLPDRPAATPYSFEEVTLAVHEADPIVVDVPDLVTWVQDQPGMVQSARAFADNSGLEW